MRNARSSSAVIAALSAKTPWWWYFFIPAQYDLIGDWQHDQSADIVDGKAHLVQNSDSELWLCRQHSVHLPLKYHQRVGANWMSFHDCDLAVIKSLKPYKNKNECSFNLLHKGRDDSFFFSFLRQMDLLDCEKITSACRNSPLGLKTKTLSLPWKYRSSNT